MRCFFWGLIALLACRYGFADEIKVKKEDVAHFMEAVAYLQSALMRTNKLSGPEEVRAYRDLMNVLRRHQATVGNSRFENQTPFASAMWKANPWINRNLNFADVDFSSGASRFKAAWKALDENTDWAISQSETLRAPLLAAAKAIEATAGLESAPGEQTDLVVSAADLETAVGYAALGLSSFPFVLQASEWRRPATAQRAAAMLFFFEFLQQEEPRRVLTTQARTSLQAATALALLTRHDYKRFVIQLGNLTEKKGGEFPFLTFKEGSEALVSSHLNYLSAEASVVRHEAERGLPPSGKGTRIKGETTLGRVNSPGMPFTEAEARVLAAIVKQMFADLDALAVNQKVGDRDNPSRRALVNSASALHALFVFLRANPDNHLRRHFQNLEPWNMAKWMKAAQDGSPTLLTKLVSSLFDEAGVKRVVREIEAIPVAESALIAPGNHSVDLSRVDPLEGELTEKSALPLVAMSIQTLSANLVNRARAGQVSLAQAGQLTFLVHQAIALLAFRQTAFGKVAIEFSVSRMTDHETKEIFAAAALLANLSRVLEALTFLENGFAAAASGPFSVEEGARYLYELVTSFQFPPRGNDAGGAEAVCMDKLNGQGQMTRPPQP